MSDVATKADGGTAKIIYILYLVSLLLGITSIIGVIMAYVNKGSGPDWLESHYRFQIRTFWIGLLIAVIGIVTSAIFIGVLILLFYVVWLIVRCVKGMKFLDLQQPLPDEKSWLFG